MYNVGLIGCGRWGSNHLNVLANEVGTSINNLYVVDTDPIQHEVVEKCFTIDEFDQVLDLIDIAIIASPQSVNTFAYFGLRVLFFCLVIIFIYIIYNKPYNHCTSKKTNHTKCKHS